MDWFTGAFPKLGHIILYPKTFSENIIKPILDQREATSLYTWMLCLPRGIMGRAGFVDSWRCRHPSEIGTSRISQKGGLKKNRRGNHYFPESLTQDVRPWSTTEGIYSCFRTSNTSGSRAEKKNIYIYIFFSKIKVLPNLHQYFPQFVTQWYR